MVIGRVFGDILNTAKFTEVDVGISSGVQDATDNTNAKMARITLIFFMMLLFLCDCYNY